MPPAAITGSPARKTSPRSSTSGPASDPSRAVLVTSSRLTPAAAQSCASAAAVVPELLVQPSTATSPSRTSIATTSRSANRVAAAVRKLGERAAVPTMTRSAPAAIASAIALVGAIAAPDLEREPARGCNALDEPERRSADECSVEVDEVQAPRALVAEPAGKLDGIAALDRHGLAPSLVEADDASFEDVDRRQDIEVLC